MLITEKDVKMNRFFYGMLLLLGIITKISSLASKLQ